MKIQSFLNKKCRYRVEESANHAEEDGKGAIIVDRHLWIVIHQNFMFFCGWLLLFEKWK